VRTFTSPQTSLGDLDAASMARLIGIVSDITLILDGDGVILDAAFQSRQLLDALNDSAGWVSQTFGSIVAADSRTKTAALLQDAMGHAAATSARLICWRRIVPAGSASQTPVGGYGIHTFDWTADWAARAKPAAMAANCAHPARMVLGPGGL